MPSTLFLSYARADLALAENLERDLTTLGITIWRDQQQLLTGDRWPKALGEAIAATGAFLLLWSAHSAQSHFVEFEWTTALALKKPILPCLLDQTPLPPSLAACQATSLAANAPDAPTQIRAALTAAQSSTPASSPENTDRVLHQLAGIQATSPAAALHQFRTVIQGSIYQAGRDIYIGTNPQPGKRQIWAAVLVVAILIALGLTLALRHGNVPVQPFPTATDQDQPQPFAGSIWDNANEPLPAVKVVLLLNGKLLGSAVTDNLGRYTLRITAAPEAEVTLLAQKPGFHTEKRYTQLGNTNFNFTMNPDPR